jgi:hypothetical protein
VAGLIRRGVKGKPVPSPRYTPGGFTDEYRKDETKGEHRLTLRVRVLRTRSRPWYVLIKQYASRSFLIARGIIEKGARGVMCVPLP